MGLLGAAKDKEQYELTPVGEYVWTLWDMTEETGQYGQQVKWVWLISPVSDPDHYIERNNGSEQEIWQFTKPSLAKGTRARIWAEALLGRELKTGEEPDDTDLIRKRMVALLVHKANKNDPTIRREAISEEIPPRPYRPAQTAAPASRAAAQPVSAAASQEDVDTQLAASDAMRARVKKLIRNAELDETPGHEGWAATDLSSLADADVEALGREIKEAMLAAV
jgi:hypothetical protein